MSLQSEAIDQLMTALAKAQGEMSHASKDSMNPHFKSKYADLAAVWQACRDPLARNGLAVTQTLDMAGEKQVLVTTLGHSSGQWMKSIIILPIQKPGSQELGSCMSYCRRYSLAAMVGVYQDDDDGEAASRPYREPPKPSEKTLITVDEVKKINEMLKELSPELLQFICTKFNVKHIGELIEDQVSHVMKVLETARKKKEEANGKN